MMKVLWICGLPNEVRLNGWEKVVSSHPTAAWSWILGHLPPPDDIELHILCPVIGMSRPRLDFDCLGVRWHCFRQRRFEQAFLWLRFFPGVRKFVKDLNPDVIHGWGGEMGGGWLATLLTRNAIVSVQGLLRLFRKMLKDNGEKRRRGLAEMILFFLERQTYRRAEVLLTESETSRIELKSFYGEESVVVPHPLRAAFLRERSECPHDGVRFLFVGSMTARKGCLDAIKAFSQVKFKKVSLVMVGCGDQLEAVRDRVDELGEAHCVRVIPRCTAEEVQDLMDASDVFVLPSYGDTGPTVLKEALARGLYPVCYDNTGPKELVERYCGRLVRTGDIERYSIVLDEVCYNINKIRAEADAAARQIKQDLNVEKVWEELRRVYQNV